MPHSRAGVAVVGTLMCILLGSVGAAAKTTVSVKAKDVTITVPIDAPGLDKAGAVAWESAASIWNTAFKYWWCFNMKLVVDVTPRTMDFPAQPNRHIIFAVKTAGDTPRGTIEKGGRGDSPVPYQRGVDGQFDQSLNKPHSVIVAHEIGHVLGLGDDYTVVSEHPRRTRPLPGREDTLMADGGPIDDVLLSRLYHLLRQANADVPECWTGTWKVHFADSRSGPNFPWEFDKRDDSLEATFEFTVAKDGAVTGRGRARVAFEWKSDWCQSPRTREGKADECRGRCTNDLSVNPDFDVFLDVGGLRDESGKTFMLELLPAPGERVTADMTTVCMGEPRARTYTRPFDYFDCRRKEGLGCAVTNVLLRAASIPAKPGGRMQLSPPLGGGSGTLHGEVTINPK